MFDRSAAIELGLEPGDTVTLARGERTSTFTVAGTAIDLTDCGYPQCDPIRVFVSTSGLDRLGGAQFAMLFARLADSSSADAAAARLLATVPGVNSTESWPDTRGDLLAVDQIFGRFITVFGVFVLVASCVVVAGSMVVRMTARRREIGLLEAVGCTSRQVTLALVFEHLAIGFVAAMIGWGVAGFLAPQLQIGVSDVIGRSSVHWSLSILAVTLAVFGVILAATTIIPAWRAGRLPVSDVIRDAPPERLSTLARHSAGLAGPIQTLGVDEVAARPARSLLAAMAVALAVVTAIVSSGFIRTIGQAVDSPGRVGDPWDATIVPGDGTPPDVVEAALLATKAASSWYTETGRRSTIGDEAFLSQAIGGDPEAARFEIGEGRSIERSGEAIIGYGMVNRFDLGVGDTVTFSAGGVPLTVTIVGWYRELEDSGEVLQYRLEQLQAVQPATRVSNYRVTAAEGFDSAGLASALTTQLGDSATVEAQDPDTGALGAFGAVLRLITVVVGAVAAANLLSMMLTSTRESARTIGIEQALGFTPRQLVAHGVLGAATIGLIGVVVGVPFGLWLYRVMSDAVTSLIGAGPGFGRYPSVADVLLFGAAALAMAAALGALATRRLANRPPAELVRWE